MSKLSKEYSQNSRQPTYTCTYITSKTTFSGKTAKMRPYDPTSEDMQWVIVGDRIQNKVASKMVLDIHKASKSRGADVIAYKFTGAENQRWKFEYV